MRYAIRGDREELRHMPNDNPLRTVAVAVLTPREAKREYASLQEEIAGHDIRYYQHDAPAISDADYDARCVADTTRSRPVSPI